MFHGNLGVPFPTFIPTFISLSVPHSKTPDGGYKTVTSTYNVGRC